MARARGRKSKAAIEAVLKKIEVGVPIAFAAVSGGVCRQTWHKWVKASEKLQERVAEARAKAVAMAVLEVRQAARDSWQAAAWYLERTEPEHFALHTTQDIRHLGDGDEEDVVFAVKFNDGASMAFSVDADDETEEAA